MRFQPRIALCAAALAVGLSAAACVQQQRAVLTGPVHVLGPSQVNAATMAAWYRANTPVAYRATVPVGTLAELFVWEGGVEGVRGDIAFVQGIVETGWYGFTGSVPPEYNNFAGIGATDSGGAPNQFPDARTGVRAQIQHLVAYADPGATTCTVPPLHQACVDPRFDLVSPKGRAPSWNEMGNGNWATDPTYASKVIALYNRLRAYAGLPRYS